MSTAHPSSSSRPGSSNSNLRAGSSNSSRRASIVPDTPTAIHKSANGSVTRPSTASSVPETGSASTSNQLLTTSTNQQKARAKDLLRKHYGLGIGPPPPRPVGSNSQDPMDMNSSAFDAKSYYEQLITTSSLPALLKRENELLSEIRQLEGERQSLVYNHHHELIAASDTISAMKTRAEGLDGDLELLRGAFSDISRLTAEVSVEQTRGTEDDVSGL